MNQVREGASIAHESADTTLQQQSTLPSPQNAASMSQSSSLTSPLLSPMNDAFASFPQVCTVSEKERTLMRQEGALKQRKIQILGIGMQDVQFGQVLHSNRQRSHSSPMASSTTQSPQKGDQASSFTEPLRNKTSWDYLLDEMKWMRQQQKHVRKRKRLEGKHFAMESTSQLKKVLAERRAPTVGEPSAWETLLHALKDLNIPSGVVSATGWKDASVPITTANGRTLNSHEQEQVEFLESLHSQRKSALIQDASSSTSRFAATQFIHRLSLNPANTGRNLRHIITVSSRESMCEWVYHLQHTGIPFLLWPYDNSDRWNEQFEKLGQTSQEGSQSNMVCLIPFGLLLKDTFSVFFAHQWSSFILDDVQLYYDYLFNPSYESIQHMRATSKILLDHSPSRASDEADIALSSDANSPSIAQMIAYLLSVLPKSSSFYCQLHLWMDIHSELVTQSSLLNPFGVGEQLRKILKNCLSAFGFHSKYDDALIHKLDQVHEKHLCRLSERQSILYQRFRAVALAGSNIQWTKPLIHEYATDLQLICNHPDLLDENDVEHRIQAKFNIPSIVLDRFNSEALANESINHSFEDSHDSGKMIVLWSLLERYRQQGAQNERVLIVTHNAKMIPHLEDFLEQIMVPFHSLLGGESLDQHLHACKAFNESPASFCFITTFSNPIYLRNVKHVLIWDLISPNNAEISNSFDALSQRLAHSSPSLVFHYFVTQGTFEAALGVQKDVPLPTFLKSTFDEKMTLLAKALHIPYSQQDEMQIDTDMFADVLSEHAFLDNIKVLEDTEYQVYEINPETRRAFEATITAPEIFPDSMFEDHLRLDKPSVLKEIEETPYEVPILDEKPVMNLRSSKKRKRPSAISTGPADQFNDSSIPLPPAKITKTLKKRKMQQKKQLLIPSSGTAVATPVSTMLYQETPRSNIKIRTRRPKSKPGSKNADKEMTWTTFEDQSLISSVWIAADSQGILDRSNEEKILSVNWDFIAYTLNSVFGQTATPRSSISCRTRFEQICDTDALPQTLLTINNRVCTKKLQKLVNEHQRHEVKLPTRALVKDSSHVVREYKYKPPLAQIKALDSFYASRKADFSTFFMESTNSQRQPPQPSPPMDSSSMKH